MADRRVLPHQRPTPLLVRARPLCWPYAHVDMAMDIGYWAGACPSASHGQVHASADGQMFSCVFRFARLQPVLQVCWSAMRVMGTPQSVTVH